jgi:hypothetical protein
VHNNDSEAATLPPGEDDDAWVLLGQWAIDHAGEAGIPFEDHGSFFADWGGRCGVCGKEVLTGVALPVHPRWVGWENPGDGGSGRLWCTICGASVWGTLVSIRKVDVPSPLIGN